MAEGNKSVASNRIKLGSILIVLFLLLYIPSVIFWVYGKNVSTDIVRMGDIQDSVNLEAIIVRDEVVLNSPIGGKCIKEINEGEKAMVNGRIATVLNQSSEKLLEDLKALDVKIIDAQKKRNENLELFSDDLKKLENEIEEKLKEVIKIGNTNELSKSTQLKKEVDELIQKKATIAGSLSKPDSHIQSLLNEKSNLQRRINENTRGIKNKIETVIWTALVRSIILRPWGGTSSCGSFDFVTRANIRTAAEGIKENINISIQDAIPETNNIEYVNLRLLLSCI